MIIIIILNTYFFPSVARERLCAMAKRIFEREPRGGKRRRRGDHNSQESYLQDPKEENSKLATIASLLQKLQSALL